MNLDWSDPQVRDGKFAALVTSTSLPSSCAANDNTTANDNHSRIIAFTGLAGSGKSTAADYLVGRGYTRVKFAGPLKAMCRAIGLTDEHIEGRLKEEPCDLLLGWTPRYAMQTLGTEWGRDILGASFWTNLWRMEAAKQPRIVCDDCRFENEATAVRDLGGIVVRMEGRGGLARRHASEAGVKPDVVIRNVHGIADLYERIDEVLAGAADERGRHDGRQAGLLAN